MAEEDEKQPIIIKRVKKGGGGHHGGAWKVAYADFVTAMMAFFLLLWLLNVTTDEQKQLISAYFSPADPRVSESVSGSGGVMGGTTMSPDGAMVSDKEPVVGQPGPPSSNATNTTGEEAGGPSEEQPDKEPVKIEEDALEAEMIRREEEAFKSAEEELRQAIESMPEMRELAQNLLIDQTPEGLRIQIVDQEGKPMFPLGSADMFDITKRLLQLIAEVIKKMPNKISIRGHTDSYNYAPGAKYTNWELSAERANASRRALLDSGLDLERIENVMGKADREHLLPDQPTSARNRRISIILLKESIVPGIHKEGEKQPEPLKKLERKEPDKPVKPPADPEIPARPQRPPHPGREEGIIYFP